MILLRDAALLKEVLIINFVKTVSASVLIAIAIEIIMNTCNEYNLLTGIFSFSIAIVIILAIDIYAYIVELQKKKEKEELTIEVHILKKEVEKLKE